MQLYYRAFGEKPFTLAVDSKSGSANHGALPLVFGRPLSYKIQVNARCGDLEECR